MLKDGTLGLKAIKEAGGMALVQSPEEADYPEMPQSAVDHDGAPDLIAPVDALASEICRLLRPKPSAEPEAGHRAGILLG
jgi:chemotaxis response regulator CheB